MDNDETLQILRGLDRREALATKSGTIVANLDRRQRQAAEGDQMNDLDARHTIAQTIARAHARLRAARRAGPGVATDSCGVRGGCDARRRKAREV